MISNKVLSEVESYHLRKDSQWKCFLFCPDNIEMFSFLFDNLEMFFFLFDNLEGEEMKAALIRPALIMMQFF